MQYVSCLCSSTNVELERPCSYVGVGKHRMIEYFAFLQPRFDSWQHLYFLSKFGRESTVNSIEVRNRIQAALFFPSDDEIPKTDAIHLRNGLTHGRPIEAVDGRRIGERLSLVGCASTPFEGWGQAEGEVCEAVAECVC